MGDAGPLPNETTKPRRGRKAGQHSNTWRTAMRGAEKRETGVTSVDEIDVGACL